MGRYLRILALFLFPIMVLLATMEVMLRDIPNDYTFKRHFLETRGASLRILALGSSHAFRDIDPAQLPCPAFNAANISQTYVHDLAILRKHIGDLPRLQWLLIPASYGSLRSDPEHSKENWRAKNYVIYHGLPQFAREPKNLLEFLNHPLTEQWHMIRDHLRSGKSNRVCDDLGAGLEERPLPDDLDLSARKAAKRHTFHLTGRVPVNRNALEQMIGLADQHHVQVLLYTPPASMAYREAIDREQFEEMTSIMAQLVAANTNVTYLNYFEEASILRTDFADGDHLNPQGAKKFTRLIGVHITCR